MCMLLCLHGMYVCASGMCLELTEARRGHGIPGTGVANSYGLSCKCWEQNSHLLGKQQALLAEELFLQLPISLLTAFL